MKKIYQYILMAVALVATASCSNELDDTLQPVENGTLQFVVSDFPAFGEGVQTRAIGTQDAGKTEWENGDAILVSLTSAKYGEQTTTLTYDGSAWTSSGTLSYLENEIPTVSAVYNPFAETPGLGEYLVTTDYTIADNTLNISFANAARTYSRLRIAGLANQTLTVTTTDFTPAGSEGVRTPESYALTTDDKGNAYLYGTFAEGATVTVKKGDAELITHPFTTATVQGKSYALFAGVTVDLSKLTETYVINDSKNYHFTGTGSYGIKVESGNPGIVLNGANITLTDGDYYGSPVNGIHIDSTSGTTTIQVAGESSITAKAGAGIFVAEGGTVKITGSSREDALTVTGAQGCSGIGGYIVLYDSSDIVSFNCGNITIDNVTIHAHSKISDIGDTPPGIGSVGTATCGTITINNAVVYAYGTVPDHGYIGAAAIGSGFTFMVDSSTSIPTVIVNNSSVHTYRSNPYSDYIGWAGDANGSTDATGSINCGEGGSITDSTIYCYTIYGNTTDKTVTYDADGNPTEQLAE